MAEDPRQHDESDIPTAPDAGESSRHLDEMPVAEPLPSDTPTTPDEPPEDYSG